MSQKSPVTQIANFVPRALTQDKPPRKAVSNHPTTDTGDEHLENSKNFLLSD
jgi:hypothetical protein